MYKNFWYKKPLEKIIFFKKIILFKEILSILVYI